MKVRTLGQGLRVSAIASAACRWSASETEAARSDRAGVEIIWFAGTDGLVLSSKQKSAA
jgi:hypothetical protein